MTTLRDWVYDAIQGAAIIGKDVDLTREEMDKKLDDILDETMDMIKKRVVG